jgi:hypothetical protein
LFLNIHKTIKMKKNLLLNLLLLVAAVMTFSVTKAQYYSLSKLYAPGNPGGVNTDADYDGNTGAIPAGATKLITFTSAKAFTAKYSTVQTLPFTFNFNGGPVTKYKVGSTGYLTFSTTTAKIAGTANAALPSASLPDSSICCWGLGGCTSGFGQVYKKTYGVAPHRQLWIGFWAMGNPSDSNSLNWWSIVLEETTNNIYVVDQWGNGVTYNGGTFNPINLTVGVQVNSTTAYQIAGSPNVNALTVNAANSDNDYYEFIPGVQPKYDASVVGTNITNKRYYGLGGIIPISANVANFGSANLTDFNLMWNINGNVSGTHVSGLNLASSPAVQYDSATATWGWIPTVPGTYTLKLYANALDGGFNDQNNSNDTLTVANIQVIDTVVPKMVVLEEFMQASCDPCLNAAPNLDSVLTDNQTTCLPMRYHVSWPGTDYMNNETQTPFVASRVSYYGVSGVPDAKLDGSTDVSPASLSSSDIYGERIKGSPFWIQITSCTYDPITNIYSLSAGIKSHMAMPAGLVAQTVLTVDTIKYVNDQSTEDPPSYFGTSGYYPTSWYQYVLNFPQVAEAMIPSSAGTSLGAFTAGQTQTINVNWTKNRPWGSSPKTYLYDSVGFHITVFVQSNTTKYIYQAAIAPNPMALGVNEISNNVGNVRVYPNPFNDQATVVYNLNQLQNVNIEVWNLMGQKVMALNQGKQTQGKHEVVIGKDNLAPGMYLLRLVTDQGVAIQKIEIQ